MKNRSDRKNINRPKHGYRHKYTKYKRCLGKMMSIYVLSATNIPRHRDTNILTIKSVLVR